jgi:hypothetical protein
MSQKGQKSTKTNTQQYHPVQSVYGKVPKRLRRFKASRSTLIVVALACGAFGAYLFFSTKAATPFASLEAERGTLKGAANLQNNSDASDGAYVRFGSTTPPTSDAPFGLPLIKRLNKTSDWDSVLTEAPGSSITNQPDGSIRIWQPDDGERTELQVHKPADGGVPSHGYEAFYTWEFKISPSTQLYSGHNTISQFHGNNNAGYTGGMVVAEDRPPEKLRLRVKGGEQLSTSGSHRYEYESDRGDYAVPDAQLTTTAFQRGVWNKVEYHVLWTDKWNGFAKMRFNGGPWFGVDNVPTASDIADVQMFRVGWYPGSDNVPSGGLEMFVRNVAVYGKPSN